MPFAFNNKYFVRAVGAVQNYAKLLDTSTAGTYSITLDKESVIKVVLVGGGGAAAMLGRYDDRGYGWTGGSGGAFEGSFTVPAGTYEVVVGSANNNNKAQGGNTNTMNPDDTSKHDSYITGVVRVGGGGSGTTSGVGAAGASATFDVTPIKTVINTSGKAGASGSGGKGSGANWTHNGAESVYGGYGKGQGCSTSEYANRRYWIAGTNGYARVEVISKKEFDKAVKYYDTVYPEYRTIAINPDPADAVVTINGEVTNSKVFKKWTTVEYSVEKDGYRSETGSVKLKDNVELDVDLLKVCTVTIIPDKANAVVTINGEATNTVTVLQGSQISYKITLDGYNDEEDTITVVEDLVLNVTMRIILDPVRFDYTGDFQTYTVPEGCKKLEVDVVAAKGGGYNNAVGGKGGRVEATLNVTPGQTLYIYVGTYPTPDPYYRVYPAYNASDIRTDNTGVTDEASLWSRLVVAGGGGYWSWANTSAVGGNGGGLVGGTGHTNTLWSGQGGTQTAGGAAAAPTSSSLYKNAEAGKFGLGGKGAYFTNPNMGLAIAGCGGAGWYGGGGATTNSSYNTGQGGGGSSYTHPDLCTNVVHTQGYSAATGNGWVIIKPL